MRQRKYRYDARLSEHDRSILRAFEPVVDGLADLFGNHCEVILHSLEDLGHSTVKIANKHVTGREVGSPLTDLGLQILKKADSYEKSFTGSYYGNKDGKHLKSTTILIRNNYGKLIGFLCINIDLSVPLLEFIKGFLSEAKLPLKESVELYPSSVDDLIERTLKAVMTDIQAKRGLSPSKRNKLIVSELYTKGVFDVRGRVDIIARAIGISRYTVYNYIREAKLEISEPSYLSDYSGT